MPMNWDGKLICSRLQITSRWTQTSKNPFPSKWSPLIVNIGRQFWTNGAICVMYLLKLSPLSTLYRSKLNESENLIIILSFIRRQCNLSFILKTRVKNYDILDWSKTYFRSSLWQCTNILDAISVWRYPRIIFEQCEGWHGCWCWWFCPVGLREAAACLFNF